MPSTQPQQPPPAVLVCVLALILAAPLAAAHESVHGASTATWILGKPNESCSSVCSPSHGREPCHLPSMLAVNKPHLIERIKIDIGVSAFACSWNATNYSLDGPSFDRIGSACTLAMPASTCESKPASATAVRVCCCSDTGCITSIESLVDTWLDSAPDLLEPSVYLPLDGFGLLMSYPRMSHI